MRLIDADNVVFEFTRMLDNVDARNAKPDQKEEFKIIRTYIEWARYVVECVPTVDAVDRELYEQCKFDKDIAEEQLKKRVICKDCERVRFDYQDKQYPCFCDKWLQCVEYDDDCSYGERRDE